MYSIKAVSQATGLTVETLRAWERRYGIVVPARDDGGRRLYRAEDVLRLRRLREATERGHAISRLAHLSEEGLASLLDDPQEGLDRTAGNALVERILDAARRFRSAECEQVLTLAIAMLPPQRLVRDVLQPLLREVGDRWHRGEFAISQERLVSTVVRRHVALMLDAYDRTARRGPVVFATLPGERHELGLLTSAMVCASHGFKVHYLGPDLPPAEIARYARETGSAAVGLSLVLCEHLQSVPHQLTELVDGLPAETVVWLGGAAARQLAAPGLPGRCHVLQDAADLERRLELMRD
jgi:DNA-binding transcriptional MerR regulator/methylmalonyl-CoA mutase cobalamin-binding subunit